MKLKALKSDLAAEADGKWFEYEGGIRLKVARLGNPKHAAFLRKRRKDAKTDADFETLSAEAIARHVLLDWTGVDGEDGKPLAYSAEVGVQTLTDPTMKDFMADVVTLATRARNFRLESIEDAAGN
jgi:hypothetical protein